MSELEEQPSLPERGSSAATDLSQARIWKLHQEGRVSPA